MDEIAINLRIIFINFANANLVFRHFGVERGNEQDLKHLSKKPARVAEESSAVTQFAFEAVITVGARDDLGVTAAQSQPASTRQH